MMMPGDEKFVVAFEDKAWANKTSRLRFTVLSADRSTSNGDELVIYEEYRDSSGFWVTRGYVAIPLVKIKNVYDTLGKLLKTIVMR